MGKRCEKIGSPETGVADEEKSPETDGRILAEAEAEELFDELMAWDEETQEPDLTQIEEIVLKLQARFGKQLAEKILEQPGMRQPAEWMYYPSYRGKTENKGAKRNQMESQ